METRYVAALAVFALIFAGVPAKAQTQPVVTEVAVGDDDANRAAEGTLVSLVFIDADGDSQIDLNPDETVYLALQRPKRVSFGDIRLTSFLTYPSGTAVNYTNRDLDFATREVDGWFAQDGQGGWYVDGNADRTVNVGDLNLNPGEGVEKVQANDPETGRSLERVQSDVTASQRVLFVDEGPPGLDWTDRLYLDLDGNDQATPGELRFQASRLGIDDNPTGREFRAAIDELKASDEALRSELVQNDEEMDSRIDTLETQLSDTEANLAQAQADLETKDNWLLALGLVNLVAVAGVGYWVYQIEQEETE